MPENISRLFSNPISFHVFSYLNSFTKPSKFHSLTSCSNQDRYLHPQHIKSCPTSCFTKYRSPQHLAKSPHSTFVKRILFLPPQNKTSLHFPKHGHFYQSDWWFLSKCCTVHMPTPYIISMSPPVMPRLPLYLLYRFPTNLRHDGTLSTQVLITQAQKVVDYKRWKHNKFCY